MNQSFPDNARKLILGLIILVLVQLACSGLSPTDPLAPVIINLITTPIEEIIDQIQVLPGGYDTPPRIIEITAGENDQPELISGIGKTSLSLGVNLSKTKTIIRLYRIKLNGCNQDPSRMEMIAETTVNDDGSWNITQQLTPAVIVGATQVINDKESGLSNLKIFKESETLLILDDYESLDNTYQDIFTPLVIKGTSFQDACVIVQNEDDEIGRVGAITVNQNLEWDFSLPLKSGENNFKIFLDGWDEEAKEITINTFFPEMQWPYVEKDSNNNFTAPVTAWFGRNDYHDKCLYTNHNGIDIGATNGTQVHAVSDGEVFYIQRSNAIGSGGNVVLIDHGGWFSVYMHLSAITIQNHATPTTSTFYDNPIPVNAGDVIGSTGASGMSCASGCPYHLHFSALRWVKGDRVSTLGNNRNPVFYREQHGFFYNINPPCDISLWGDVDSTELINNWCSDNNVWDVDWSNVRIDYTKDGVQFTDRKRSELGCD